MSHPEYRYQPWSEDRRRRASLAAKKRSGSSSTRRPTISQQIQRLIDEKREEIRRLQAEIEIASKELADIETAIAVLKRYGLWD